MCFTSVNIEGEKSNTEGRPPRIPTNVDCSVMSYAVNRRRENNNKIQLFIIKNPKKKTTFTHRKRAETFRMDRRLVDEDFFTSTLGDDEAKTLLDIEPLDGPILRGKETEASGVDTRGLLPDGSSE